MSILRVKPIDALMSEADGGDQALKRVLSAGDLIMLAIGAVIGAGIFGSIGSAAAGQLGPNGEVIRLGAGPALIVSFIQTGVVGAGLSGFYVQFFYGLIIILSLLGHRWNQSRYR